MKNSAIYIRVGTAKQLNIECEKGVKKNAYSNNSSSVSHCNPSNNNSRNV